MFWAGCAGPLLCAAVARSGLDYFLWMSWLPANARRALYHMTVVWFESAGSLVLLVQRAVWLQCWCVQHVCSTALGVGCLWLPEPSVCVTPGSTALT